jgi:hypothetical protein
MKRIFALLIVSMSFIWVACIRNDGFSPEIIEGPLVLKEALVTPVAVREILNQPFHYLGKGRQCFVFESLDQKYVLKFFNQTYLKMPWYSLFFEEKERAKRNLRRSFYETSYEIAYRELGEEILYLHMGPSEDLPQLLLQDRVGQEHLLDLNSLPFVLQKRGTPLYVWLDELYKKEGNQGLCRAVDEFVFEVQRRISKNIADADHDVEHNWGYVDGHIFHLDPGRLYYQDLTEPVRLREEWARATRNLDRWLKIHYPEASAHLQNVLTDLH